MRLTRRRAPRSLKRAAAAVSALVVLGALADFAAAASSAVAPRTLVVATVEPTEGYFRDHNRWLANGISVAVQELDAAGGIGKKFKLDLIRGALSSETSADAFVARLAAKGARVLVLPCGIDSRAEVAAAAVRRRMLILAPCDTTPADAGRYPLYWPVGMAGNAQAAQLVGTGALDNGSTAYLLTSNGPAYVSVMAGYLKAAMRLNHVHLLGTGKVTLGDPSTVDALVDDLKRLQPRIIYTPIFSPYLQDVVAELRTKGVLFRVYATDGADAGFNIGRYQADLLADLSFTTYGFARPTSKKFFRDYYQTYRKRALGSYPGLGFEVIHVLETAVQRARSIEPTALDGALAKGFKLTGVTLGDTVYPGHGSHLPVADVGVASIIRGQYTILFSGIPTRVPRA